MKVCALYDLRLSVDEFWDLLPCEFEMLYERHQAAIHHRDLMTAQIAAAVINFSTRAPEQPVEVNDLMPLSAGTRSRRARRERGPSKKALETVAALNMGITLRIAAMKAKAAQGIASG